MIFLPNVYYKSIFKISKGSNISRISSSRYDGPSESWKPSLNLFQFDIARIIVADSNAETSNEEHFFVILSSRTKEIRIFDTGNSKLGKWPLRKL